MEANLCSEMHASRSAVSDFTDLTFAVAPISICPSCPHDYRFYKFNDFSWFCILVLNCITQLTIWRIYGGLLVSKRLTTTAIPSNGIFVSWFSCDRLRKSRIYLYPFLISFSTRGSIFIVVTKIRMLSSTLFISYRRFGLKEQRFSPGSLFLVSYAGLRRLLSTRFVCCSCSLFRVISICAG